MSLRENQMPREDFELPNDEPPAPFPEEFGTSPPVIETESALNINDLGLDLPPDSFTGTEDSGGGFDFGDFLEAGGLDNLGMDSSIEPPPDDVSFGETETGSADIEMPEYSGGQTMASEDSPSDDLSSFLDSLDPTGSPEAGDFPVESSFPVDEEPPTAEDFSTEDIPTGDISTEPEESSDFDEITLGRMPIEDTDGFNMDDIGSMETPAGESDFSGIEFPDIDLSQSVDMGGETPSPEAGGSDGIEFPDIDLSQAVDMGGETASPQISMEDDSGAFSAGEDISGDEDYSFDLDQGEAGSFGETLPETGDFSMDMPDGDDFNAGDFVSDDSAAGDFDTGDIGFDAGSGSFDAGQTDDFDFNDTAGDFSTEESLDIGSEDLGSGFDTEFGESDQDITLDTEDIGNFDDIPASAETGDESIDPFESFASGDTTLDTPDFNETPADEFGDFSLSGFDDVGESGKPAKAAAFGTTQGSPDEVEEIQLNEDDYQQLQDTLSAYPLNLRIACEELIAEQAVAPDKMSALVNLLVRGAPAKETAGLAGKILGKTITIPKGYSKKTGAELEAEQASFGYIFTHRFLPVLKIAGAIVLVTASLGYLIWRFAVIPLQAERRYKEGYALIQSGEYVQANERFRQAFEIHRVKNWFYRYAEAFRDERQYIYAERKYDELLRVYPQDKKGALDYAAMETYYIRNYEKADRIIRVNILDYAVNDKEGLLALAENSLAWGETDYSRYDEAREAYARLMEKYGKQDPYLEGMLKYFIRTDNLKEVLPLQAHFMSNPKKRKISVPTLAELGGYLLDKRFEDTGGVPEEFADQIEGIRDVLIRAINADRSYPESYYHLARYYSRYGNINEERQSLRDAIRAFSSAPEESPRRVGYHIDTQRLYAEILINSKEFFPAEEELIRGVRLYEDARARGIIKNPRPEFGRLYADLGDLEFYVKSGDMDAALRFYQEAERNDWSPPEMQYRMGVAYYQNEQWEEALMRFFTLTSVMPNNRRLLYALGNTAYLRGNYFAAQGYYNRLMDLLDAEKVRFPSIFPGGRPEEQDLAERIMVADNNLGVTLETLTRISGDTSYRSRALALFSESIRAWDVLTRDPESMARMQPIRDLYSPGINLAYLNTQNILRPSPNYEQQIFMRIDRDSQEPSDWEILVPRNYRLSDQLQPMTID